MKMLKFCTGYDGDKSIDLIQLKQMNNKVRILNLDNNQIFYDKSEFNQIKNGYVQISIDKFDKNGNEIYVGDILINNEGFKMIVCLEPDNKTPYCDGEREKDYFRGNSCKWNDYVIAGYCYDKLTDFNFYED